MKISPVVLDRVPLKLDKFGNDQNTFFNIHDQTIDTIDCNGNLSINNNKYHDINYEIIS